MRIPILLFEQRGPTNFVQVSPAEEDEKLFMENYAINLWDPYDFKKPKEWDFAWFLPDI